MLDWWLSLMGVGKSVASLRDEVLDHSLQPPLAVGVGRLLVLGLDAQQAVRVAEPYKSQQCCPHLAAAVPYLQSHPPSSAYR